MAAHSTTWRRTAGGPPGPPGIPGALQAARFDPYVSGQCTHTLAPGRRRIAAETYWSIRSSAPSVRQYLTLFWKGDKRSQEWHDIWTVGQSVDLALQHAHDTQGYVGVCNIHYSLAAFQFLTNHRNLC